MRKTLSQFELVTRLSGTDNSLTFEDLKLTLDDSHFSGQLAIADFAKQALRVQLKGDQLNLDRYLPAPAKTQRCRCRAPGRGQGQRRQRRRERQHTAARRANSAGLEQQRSAAHRTLRKLDAQLNLSLDQLTVQQQAISNFSAKAQSKGGLLTLQDVRGSIGRAASTPRPASTVRPAVPAAQRAEEPARHSARTLPEKARAAFARQRPARPQANLSTSGNSQRAWIEGLNGDASFLLNDGVLVDANLEQQLCRGIATLNRKVPEQRPARQGHAL